jgi:zinc transport system substrate-binding protein
VVLGTLDAIVVNGIGHDDFIDDMIAASGNKDLVRININDGAALLPGAHGEARNSHSFLSLTMAMQQSALLARRLAALQPTHAALFARNALAYQQRLRTMLEGGRKALLSATNKKVVAVHDGYAYLLQELGLESIGVVEPAHGLLPSAGELAAMVALVKAKGVRVALSEARFPTTLRAPLMAAGCRVIEVSHIASGPFSTDRFETDMARNLDVIVGAVLAP